MMAKPKEGSGAQPGGDQLAAMARGGGGVGEGKGCGDSSIFLASLLVFLFFSFFFPHSPRERNAN